MSPIDNAQLAYFFGLQDQIAEHFEHRLRGSSIYRKLRYDMIRLLCKKARAARAASGAYPLCRR